jgi:hypothetical protein
MRKFINDSGCKAEFEDGISEDEIQFRLKWLGRGWREVTEEKEK